MKNSFLLILIFFNWFNAIAQIELNGPTLLVCPGEPMVYNVSPASLTSSKGEKVTISLEAFKPGNYFVHIQNKTEVIRKQIIVEK